MDNGFILLHRKLKHSWIWRRSDYFHWFVCIVLEANFKDNDKFLFEGEFIKIKRGSFVTSYRKLSLLLPKCTEQKIRTFLKLLVKSGTIEVESLQKATRITICNYDDYQTGQHSSNTAATQQQHNSNTTATTIERKIIKKTKKINDKQLNYKSQFLIKIERDVLKDDLKEYFDITKSFYDLFENNLKAAGATTANLEKAKGTWIDHVRLIIEKDGYTLEDCRKVWKFLNENEFWKKNIMSTAKLREKFDKLLLNINSDEKHTANKRNSKEGCTLEELQEVITEGYRKRGIEI